MSLLTPIVILLISVLLLCLVFTGTVKAPWLAWFCGLAALVLVVAAAVMISNWLSWQALSRARERAEIAAITPEVALLERRIDYVRVVRTFPADLAAALAHAPALWDVLSGSPEAAIVLRTSGGNVSYQTVSEWLAGSPDETFETMPVRQCRDDVEAGWLVDHLVTFGFLERARGNRPARWVDANARERAVKFLSNDAIRLEA